jgi:hypothetical protein
VVDALQHIQDLVRTHNEALGRLHGLAVEIRTGARTYTRIPDQLYGIFEISDVINGLPDTPLKRVLVRMLEDHEREYKASGVQG